MKYLILILVILLLGLSSCSQLDDEPIPPARWRYFETTVDAVSIAKTNFGRTYTVMWIEGTKVWEWGILGIKTGQQVKVRQRIYRSGRTGKVEFLGIVEGKGGNQCGRY